MSKESVNIHVNNYCRLRDKQYAVYTEYAKKYGLTTKELFILDIIICSRGRKICRRLSEAGYSRSRPDRPKRNMSVPDMKAYGPVPKSRAPESPENLDR